MEVTIGFFVFGLFLCSMAAPPTDRTESCDGEEDEYAQKCGDPKDCKTWSYTQTSPCSYDCTCDGKTTHVLEKDYTSCGTNKWCIKGRCKDKRCRTEDRTENFDGGRNKCVEKCGDPNDCTTWTCIHVLPCSYNCTCNEKETQVFEDDFTPCGTNKWCIEGECEDKRSHKKDRTENSDGGTNKCFEKCGNPYDCRTWTCTQNSTCLYYCTCDGKETIVPEDDFTPCGSNKWCVKGKCQQKVVRTEDRTEIEDGGRNKCVEKCGDPNDCNTWTCRHYLPCSYDCSCDGKETTVFEDDRTPCGTNKWCIKGECEDKRSHKKDLIETSDGGRNKCFEKCGDPNDCRTWTCTHSSRSPCLYYCTCDGKRRSVPEDDFTPCGSNKWCVKGICQQKRGRPEDRTEIEDGGSNKCIEKCGDPNDCDAWTCRHYLPCSYDCSCDGNETTVFEDDHTPCGTNKWCIKGECEDKRSHKKDLIETSDGGRNKCFEKCGNPNDCRTWTCTHSSRSPCLYYCTCDGKRSSVPENDFTPCGSNKWCVKGKCQQKRVRTEDRTEIDDDGGDEYGEKCGDPEDCKTWNYKQAPVVKCPRTVST